VKTSNVTGRNRRAARTSIAVERLERRALFASVVAGADVMIGGPAGNWEGIGVRTCASDANGNVVVVWRGEDNDAGKQDVYARILGPDGLPKTGVFLADTSSYKKGDPTVDVAPNGNFVVSWWGSGVMARCFNAHGVPQTPEIQVSNSGYASAVAANDNGFVVAYETDWKSSLLKVEAQRFAWTGAKVGKAFPVNATNKGGADPSADMDRAGNFVVTWGAGDGSGHGIFGQRFAASGVKLGGDFVVNTYTADSQMNSRVAMAPTGEFVVVWEDWGRGSANGQRFGADGSRGGGEFAIGGPSAFASAPAVDAGAGGSYVVSWCESGSYGYAQPFDSAGVATTAPVALGNADNGGATRTAVAIQPNGFQGVWRDPGNLALMGRKFTVDPTGTGTSPAAISPIGTSQLSTSRSSSVAGELLLSPADEVPASR
jgi:hypothetical protein